MRCIKRSILRLVQPLSVLVESHLKPPVLVGNKSNVEARRADKSGAFGWFAGLDACFLEQRNDSVFKRKILKLVDQRSASIFAPIYTRVCIHVKVEATI